MDRCIDGQVYRWIDVQIGKSIDGPMDIQIDGQTLDVVGQMNGWLDEIDLQTNNKFFNCPELLFLFIKGMTGDLTPFSYLVFNNESPWQLLLV